MKSQVKLWNTPDYVYNCGRKHNDNNSVKKDKICTEKEINLLKNQNISTFLCGLCSHSFQKTQDVFKHLNEHWDNNDLACQLCDFVGIDLAAIAAHRYYHYPREGKVHYFCHICRHKLLSLMSLHFHYRKIHLGKAGGYCAQCNKEFHGLTFWKRHERKKHSAPKYICDICGKGYSFKYSIKDHMINSHLGIKQHICDICGNCFKTKKYLKAFTNSNALTMHMVTHSDERPFSCDICGASYKYKSHAKVHMLRHSGFLPHKCSQCTKAFATTTQLKVHSSVHTGVRRHACIAQNCVKTFHSKKLMFAHLQSRHKNENLEQK
ncbi:hypothetical protein HF086_000216 [Spodoptera exigua]|uniref:C2H2-type domain-containing protein n=1 Tax=Spodoptera exigua TaxID=7107 RepID=A0A922MEU1_SPOEX|nr:hypothetical protein HF086_000216 [Spodoptera exigua]